MPKVRPMSSIRTAKGISGALAAQWDDCAYSQRAQTRHVHAVASLYELGSGDIFHAMSPKANDCAPCFAERLDSHSGRVAFPGTRLNTANSHSGATKCLSWRCIAN